MIDRALLARLLLSSVVLTGCLGPSRAASPTVHQPVASSPAPQPVKVLTVIEENHSYDQMRSGMPYLFGLAQRYGYATDWTAEAHPSLPNYLAIAGGSTFGVVDDGPPSVNAAKVADARSVFDQALDSGRDAKLYAESMPGNCAVDNSGDYAVKHNPWAYFGASAARCRTYDVPLAQLRADAQDNRLPAVGMLIPNLCNDGHDCALADADAWLRQQLGPVLASRDFRTGRLAVVVTADEDDDRSGNRVLTVVLHSSLSHVVVSEHLTHYSLTRFYAQTLGVAPLHLGASAPDMRAAFGL